MGRDFSRSRLSPQARRGFARSPPTGLDPQTVDEFYNFANPFQNLAFLPGHPVDNLLFTVFATAPQAAPEGKT
jgi:hypothetical protein